MLFKRLSTKVIAIFLLMLAALVTTIFSSYIAIDTQKQHMVLTEMLSKQKLLIERVTFSTINIAEVALLNETTYRQKREQNLPSLRDYIVLVDTMLEAFRVREYPVDGKPVRLKFRAEFLPIFNTALKTTTDKWLEAKSHIAYLLDPRNVENKADFKKRLNEFSFLHKDVIDNSEYITKICREEAVRKKELSETIQSAAFTISGSIFFVLVWLILSNFYRPLREIRSIFTSMSKGELNQRFHRDQDDEFKELYANFNRFIENLNLIFSLEDKIIVENQLDEIMKYINEHFRVFIPFRSLAITHVSKEDTIVSRMISEGDTVPSVIKADSGTLTRYDKVTIDGKRVISPILLDGAYLGYVSFVYDSAEDITESSVNFLELIKDKLALGFYKSILLKDLLSIVTGSLANMTEHRDPETGKHLVRMSSYSQIIARQLHTSGKFPGIIDQRFIEDIKISAPMHDIGKVSVPDTILLKPGKLTDDEFEIMKTHATAGGAVLERIHHNFEKYNITYFQMASEIAYAHQEKFDGSGYPKGLSGNSIPLSARIVALADVFDALTSKRPYKEAFSVEQSFKIIKDSTGTHFDPVIVQAFFDAEKDILAVYEQLKEI